MKKIIAIGLGILFIAGGGFTIYKGTDTEHLAGLDTRVNSTYIFGGIILIIIGIWILYATRDVRFTD